MRSERCFVCGSSIKIENREQQSVLDRQLSAVFVLRTLIDLPSKSLLKCFLLSDGENPADWITICGGQCREIVDKAQFAYQEMCRARQMLESCQKEIRKKIRLSSSASLLHSTASQQKYYRTEILNMVWENVKKNEHTPPVLDPDDFIAGDRMAEQLLNFKMAHVSNQRPSELPAVIPKVEVESSPTFEDAEQDSGSEFDAGSTTLDIKPDLSNSENSGDQSDQDLDIRRLTVKQKLNKPQRRRRFELISCPHCDYSTDQGSNCLNRHITYKHSKVCNFPCELCDKKFRVYGDLRRHYTAIHNKCPVDNCGEICEGQRELRDHQVNTHGREVTVFKCPECDLLYRERHYLKDHLLACHRKGNEDVSVCGQCKKKFPSDYRLRAHFRNVHLKNRDKGKLKKRGKRDSQILGF